MTRSSPWGMVIALCACNGGDGDRPGNGTTELPPLVPADVDQDGVSSDDDCNDGNAAIFPGASETCNGLDDDCNGMVDDDLVASYYRDADGDTYGDPERSASACSQPLGFVTDNTDCNDAVRTIHPGAIELCDLQGVDEDCNGTANEADPNAENMRTWYVDADEDGFGGSKTVEACFEGPGLATVGNDCNDADFDMNPGTPEICDALDKDEDCDGFSDATDPEGPDGQPLYYVDVDGDGDGDMSDPGQYFCDGVPPGYSTLATDCDDEDMVINPRAPENCRDLIDNDCNGAVDDCGPIPDITLDTADTILEGSGSYAYHGWAVAGVRDVNGDGQEDFATAAWYWDSGHGAVWVYYGPMASGTFDPEDVADSMIEGSTMYGYFGFSLDQAGDVNADGFDDLIGGTQSYNNGEAYIFLGPLLGDATTAGADGTWSGEYSTDYAGQAVAGGFDFDGDGSGDTLVGAFANSSYTGAAYLIYGPGTGDNSLADAPVKIAGAVSYGYLGQQGSLTGVPDMNGDGVDEIALGQYQGASYAGAVYLFYGASLSGDYTTADADTTFTGVSSNDYLGMRIGRATDFTGDGLGDVMMGAYAADTGGYYTGSVYIVPGPGDTGGSVDSVAQVELYGEVAYEYIGQNDMDGEMDVNRDDFTDVVVGAAYSSFGPAGTYSTGTAYVVYGPQTGDVSLADARCRLTGTTSYEQAGYGVSFIGDQSGDDSPEVLVGAPYGSSYAGTAYVVWGDRL
jgi:hypothetical protein